MQKSIAAELRRCAAQQEMVAELRRQGYKALIITNGHAEIQRGKLKRLQAVDLFDGILVGGEEIAAGHAEKPAASIFLKACQMAGCTPDEVWRFFVCHVYSLLL